MALIQFLAANAPWAWIIAGLVLLGLELVVPGGFLVWLGVAGIVTGIVVFIEPIAWPWQWLLFAVLALVAILLWTRFSRTRSKQTDSPYLNRRADRFIGREAVLEQPIAGGFGRLTLDDTVWRIAGQDLPSGSRIRITGSDGAVLRVEAI